TWVVRPGGPGELTVGECFPRDQRSHFGILGIGALYLSVHHVGAVVQGAIGVPGEVRTVLHTVVPYLAALQHSIGVILLPDAGPLVVLREGSARADPPVRSEFHPWADGRVHGTTGTTVAEVT